MNVVVILLLLDLGAVVALRLVRKEHFADLQRKIDGGLLDALEQERMAWGRYEPYVVWRASGATVSSESIDSSGFRVTPGSAEGESSFRVFVFGGSTVWGCGVPDSCTVPAYLLKKLEDDLGRPVEMRNMGQIGYVSTQEVIELFLQMRRGNVPDLVVLVDGVNDVAAAYQSGVAGAHQNLPRIRSRLERSLRDLDPTANLPHPLIQLARGSSLYTVLRLCMGTDRGRPASDTEVINYAMRGHDPDSLASAVIEVCLSNYRFVEGLGEQWGFDCAFFWQPTVWTGDKELTENELSLASGGGGWASR